MKEEHMGEVGQEVRASEINERLGSLRDSIQKIENQVETLDSRLRPVSKGSNPPCETNAAEASSNVPMGEDI